jgi:CubicO group peptidase (beta-lactamase class C family)
VPGISAAVSIDGRLAWSGGSGFADLEHEAPARGDTVHRIASISKPLAAVGVMLLVEEGKVDLDKEIQDYVPYFPKKEHPIIVRHIMTHTSGIRHYNSGESGVMEHYRTIEDALGVFKDDPLRFEPGTRYSYSSFAYNVLAGLIEEVSGKTFEQFMTERVWGPAGMDRTSLELKDRIVPGRSRPYSRRGQGFVNTRYTDVSVKWAGGGIISSAEDLVRFADAVTGGKLVKPETLDAMLAPTILKSGDRSNYGLGFQVERPGDNGRVFGHSGSSTGWGSRLYIYPDRGVAAAAIVNLQGGGGAATRLARGLAELAIEMKRE